MSQVVNAGVGAGEGTDVAELAAAVSQRGPRDAADVLVGLSDAQIVAILQAVSPNLAGDVLRAFPDERRLALIAAAPGEISRQWARNHAYPEGSIGRMMDAPLGVFSPEMTVGEAVEQLRGLVKKAFITYGFVVDDEGRLEGVLVMRDLLLADRGARLDSLMLRKPFSLRPELSLMEGMKAVLNRHYPVYPVCDEEGHLIGLVRGQTMFEQQAIEISAQAGSMVGVEKEERLATPWPRSLKYRHPWLQLNLLTAFVAAAVVGMFQGTVEKIAILAMFLPVLAGQSGNTGCQALAVTLRAMTLGELKPEKYRRLVIKEALLGMFNGILVGVSAGIGMLVIAKMQEKGTGEAITLATITMIAMTCSCIVSGVSGALVPLTLKRLGADPATASSIFLTTATDVASMGFFLGLATWLLKSGLLTAGM